jgi:hypothetical protein
VSCTSAPLLTRPQIAHHVADEHGFEDTDKYFYRFYSDEAPKASSRHDKKDDRHEKKDDPAGDAACGCIARVDMTPCVMLPALQVRKAAA